MNSHVRSSSPHPFTALFCLLLANPLLTACEEEEAVADPGAETPVADPLMASADPTEPVVAIAPTTEPAIGGGVVEEPLVSLCAPSEPGVVRFVALGDGGEGNDMQYRVGHVMREICCQNGCDLALYLGDNFYDSGVTSLEDMQFETKFEMPYADLDIPFYVALGNHDYGAFGAGFEFWRGAVQVDYTNVSDKWTMPNEYYAFVRENVTFVALDTNAIMWGYDLLRQTEFVDDTLDNATTPWRIAYGHHPYISNGWHGDAGSYDGLPLVPVYNGLTMKYFMEHHICGKVDLYFSGHDHTRQWLPETCGTQFVVTGAAAKVEEFRADWFGNQRHDAAFADDQKPGFFWGEIQGDTLRARFYDYDGNLEFETTMTR